MRKENVGIKKEIEIEISKYQNYIEKLGKLCQLCLEKEKERMNEKYEEDDIRRDIYGLYISSLYGTRILLQTTLDFIRQCYWGKKFDKKLVIGIPIDEKIYFKEADIQLRFGSYMNFVSMFEFFAMTIRNHLKNEGGAFADKYVLFIIQGLKMEKYKEFLEEAQAIRNTIHSNGFYLPKKVKKETTEINQQDLNLKPEPNNLEWEDCFIIYEQLINITEEIINNPIVKTEEFIKAIKEEPIELIK